MIKEIRYSDGMECEVEITHLGIYKEILLMHGIPMCLIGMLILGTTFFFASLISIFGFDVRFFLQFFIKAFSFVSVIYSLGFIIVSEIAWKSYKIDCLNQ